MLKVETHYTVTITLISGDAVTIENAEGGIPWGDQAWADFQAGNTVKCPGESEGCTTYIPYDKIVSAVVCQTQTETTVEDATCQ